MVAPLVALAVSLLSKKLQDDESQAAYSNQLQHNLYKTEADIAAHRAARAGDSGYAQIAAAGSTNFPQYQGSQAGPMLAQVGSALASQRDAPEAAKASEAADSEATREAAGSIASREAFDENSATNNRWLTNNGYY